MITFKKFRMDIDGFGKPYGITFPAIIKAENKEDAEELGWALAEKYAEIYDREEWQVNNVKEL